MNDSKDSSESGNPSSAGWRTARRVLIGLAIFITLIPAFYTWENWRGNRAWTNYRQRLEAQGVTFDWSTKIPPPVPDEQNIYKAPKMTEWFVGRGSTDLLRRLTNWRTSSIGATNAIQTEAEARDYVAWSDTFAPDFELIRTALQRPYARIDCDYREPMTVIAPNFLSVRIVAQTLAQRTHCFYLLKEPEKALRELTLLHDFCRILEGAPTRKAITLVAAMVDVAVAGLYADTIAEGFRLHVWREPQLVELERQLREIQLAPCLAETFEDEPIFIWRTLETSSRADLVKHFASSTDAKKGLRYVLKYAPRGWLSQNMVVHAQLVRQFAAGFDATNQLISPRKIDEAGRVLQANKNDQTSPYDFFNVWLPNYHRAIQVVGRHQTSVNEAAIACALERYRLAHGDYPESLDALAPLSAAKFPHDVIGGQPLKYRRTGEGKYLLYSVGWNEKDDGGERVLNADGSENKELGDWVWMGSATDEHR